MRVTTFASGSSGNCTLVQSGADAVLIDAGISMRRIRDHLRLSGLSPEALRGVLITHEHSDHICGLAMLTKYYSLPLYAPAAVARELARTVPGAASCLHTVAPGEPFALGGLEILAFPTPHDAAESVGYRVTGEQVFALATDMGHVTEAVEAGLTGADVVLIEANHDLEMLRTGPYPFYLKKRILSERGHLSNDDCAALAARLARRGTRSILLGHLSRENNTPERAFRAVRDAVEDPEVFVVAAPAAERLTVEVSGALCSR